MTKSVLGIIGGSGIYDLPGLEKVRERKIDSPWGEPSAPLRVGEIAGLPVVFLSRHDKGHRLSPSDIDYRANIDVLKRAGVTDLVSLSACGSFKEELPPGTFVLIDQFVDRTHRRESSVIGMTNMPEAKLAREAEICYATVAMVTDFDCWHPDHDAVTVQDIIKVLNINAEKAKRLVARLAQDFPREHEPCPIGSDRALDTAIITAPEARDPVLLTKLDAVAGRVLGKRS